MTKYILHGGFTRVDNELNRTFFAEFMKGIPSEGNVLIVLFASENRDPIKLFTDLEERFKSQSGNKKTSFKLASENDFENQLQEANGVYIHGGNTPTLLAVLRNYPTLADKFSNKTIAGSSAGAYALATLSAAHTDEHIREGLGILPIRLVCHFESADLPPSETSLIELRSTDSALELVYLNDCEWKVVYT